MVPCSRPTGANVNVTCGRVVPSPAGKLISPGRALACPAPAPHGAFDLPCEVIATPVSSP